MMYIRTSKRPRDARIRMIAIVCGVLVVIVATIELIAPRFLSGLFTAVVRPFWRVEFSVGSGSLDSPQALLAENEDLKRQLIAMSVENQSVQALQSDNAEFMAMLGRTIATTTAMTTIMASSNALSASSTSTSAPAYLKAVPGRILAAVLVRPPFAPYDELVIDVGNDYGIPSGARVYAPGNILIGTTTDILGQTSTVILFSSPGETYPILIGPGHVPATAVGRGGGQYEAQVPQASKISQGDAVSDSSLSDAPFGIVSAVLADPANPFETVLFAPPVNIYQLRWVLVEVPDTSVKISAKK